MFTSIFMRIWKKEQLGVGLQTVDFQDVRVVRVIHPHPQVGVHAGGELAEHHRVFGDSHDRDDALALEAIAVDLGILGILDLLVRDILVIRVPGVPSDHKGQRCLLSDLLRTFPPHRIERRLHRGPVRQLGRSRNDALPSGNHLGIGGVHIVEDPFDDPVKIFLLVGSDFRAAFRCGNLGHRLSSAGGSPDGVSDILVFLVHKETEHRRLDFRVELAEHEIAFRLRETPVLLVVPRVKLEIDHKIGRLKMAFGELVLVRAVIALGSVDGLWGRHVVLDNVAQLDGRKRIAVLDARLDMNQSLADCIIALHGIGQQVLKYFAAIPVLKKVYCISHCRFKFSVEE